MSERSKLTHNLELELQSWGFETLQSLDPNTQHSGKHRTITFWKSDTNEVTQLDGMIEVYGENWLMLYVDYPTYLSIHERFDSPDELMNALAEVRDNVRDNHAIEVLDNSVAAEPERHPFEPEPLLERHVPVENQVAFMRSIALDGILNNPRESSLHKLALLLGCTIDEIHTAQTIGLERIN